MHFLLGGSTDRIIISPARRSPVLEAVLNGAHRSHVNLAPPSHPSTGRIGASLVVKKRGVTDMVRVSDARMSGTAYGTVVLHVAPEAAAGGALALVDNGDIIELN